MEDWQAFSRPSKRRRLGRTRHQVTAPHEFAGLEPAEELTSCELEPYIIEAKLKCLTLDEIFQQNRVKQLDLVHIDVEGYDYEVLKQLDLKRTRLPPFCTRTSIWLAKIGGRGLPQCRWI